MSALFHEEVCVCGGSSVCNDKLALEAAVDQLSQEKKQLYAEKMSEYVDALHSSVLVLYIDIITLHASKLLGSVFIW